jgi:enoyl-CoA hydratase
MAEPVRVATRDQVAWITLADPDRRNALGPAVLRHLRGAFADLTVDRSIRAIVIDAEGEHFCAGGDFAVFDVGVAAGRDYVLEVIGCFRIIEHARMPVIAAVQGFALGGGFELAMSCDLVVATDTAQFGLPETGIGAIPGYAIVRLPELIGRQRAKRLMWTGERLGSQEAQALGLVTAVVPADGLAAAAEDLARQVILPPRVAVELVKAAANREIADRSLFESTTAAALMWGTEGIAEGRRAFYERRTPVFPDE